MPIKSNNSDPKCKKVYIETFGCQMNVHDSDRMKRILLANSFEITNNEKEADAVILNTCSIRDKAEKKVLSRIGRLNMLRRKKPDLVIGISGCMAQRLGEKLVQEVEGVNLVFGTHVIPSVAYLLQRSFSGDKVVDVTEKGVDDFEFTRIPEDGATVIEGASAYVTIMNGCNNYCSYCIVPYVRGREISREPKEILSEIKSLSEKGVKEVTLLGQNVNSYGNNSGFSLDFSDLLEEVEKIDAIKRIRFVTSHPKDLSDKLISKFDKLSKLCEHIHLPVQSGSDKVLKLMNRGYGSADYRKLIEKLKNASPKIAITTDIIVAYPGEDEKDFKDTIELVNWVKFDGAYSFKYSKRPGTTAGKEESGISPEVAALRLSELQELQKEITYQKNKEVLGTVQEVLVEGESRRGDGEFFGRTRSNKIVNFSSECGIRTFVSLKITKANKNSLFGEVSGVIY